MVFLGLDQSVYFVDEASGFVQVCVQLLGQNSSLERAVAVNIRTLETTATGKYRLSDVQDVQLPIQPE